MKLYIFNKFVILLIIMFIMMFSKSFANSASVDSSFDTGLPVGFDNLVKTLKIQIDGKIIFGGNFTSYNGITTNYIVRLTADGKKDFSFNIGNGFNSGVNSIAIQADRKILVGGSFTSYGGDNTNRIVRLNADGSRDTSFNMGNGFNNNVNSIAIQSDGKILVGGSFTSYGGDNTNRIVRLNADGSRDTSFDIGSGFDNSIDVLIIQSDGKILVGGSFTSYSGVNANRIIRLNTDGSRDTSFDIGNGFNSGVNSIAIHDDGKILVGGSFTSYSGITTNYIIRLNTGGSRDTSFDMGNGFNAAVNSIAIQSDRKILIGGSFTSYSGVNVNRIIRLNTDGSRDTSLNIGSSFNSYANVVAIQADGKILVGGNFITYNRVAINRIVRLNTDGSRDTSFDIGNGFNSYINAVAVQSDGKVLVGGQFTSYGGTTLNRILRLNVDGSRDTSFSSGSLSNDNVNSIAIQSDGKILIGGNFISYNLETVNRIVRLNTDGSRDNSFNMGNGFNNNVNSIAIQSDGKTLVGGSFTSYSGVNTNRIVRLNTDGSRDTSFYIGSGFDNSIDVLIIQSDGKILVGGQFTSYSGVNANRIIRLNTDGSRDTSFDMGNGFNAAINTVAVQSDGKILIGGQFTSYSGFNINRIIRLNTGGSRDTSFNIGNGFNNIIRNINIEEGNKIIVGGNFTSYSGVNANRIIRLNTDGSRDTSFNVGVGFNNYVKTIYIQNDNRILVGGNFTSYGQLAAGFLVLLYGNSDIVVIPNSTDYNVVKNEFTSKGYVQSNGDLVGSKAISLAEVDGNITTALSIKNDNIRLSIPADTQFKQSDNITNYDGIISVPTVKYINSINDEEVLSAFKVGSSLESIKLTGGVATLLAPVPDEIIGNTVDIYYSEDNGVTWYPQTTATVISYNGQPYVEFTTNHFTDFAVTLPTEQGGGEFTGSFVINNDASSTSSTGVTLNMSTTPTATHMRFSNDGSSRSSRETYTTTKSWTLPGTYGSKTVYVQFDANNDQVSDAQTSDSINYSIGGTCIGGIGEACLSLEITAVTGECRYGVNLDLGDHAQTYNAFTMTGEFLSNHTSTTRWSCNDTAGKSPWNMQISSTDLLAGSYSIANTAIEIKTAELTKYRGSDSFAGLVGAFASRGTNLSTPRKIFEKTSPAGTVGEIGIDTVDLRVLVPTNQEVGAYQATITIAYPQM